MRYQAEIEVGNKALDYLLEPLGELQARQSRLKVRQYKPDLYFIAGNHEERVARYAQENPQLEGLMSVENNLNLNRRGWQYVSYKSMLELAGVLFTHVPIMGNGQPVSGINTVYSALRICSKSTVWGHHHYVASGSVKRHGSPEIVQGLTVGGFFEDEADYQHGANNNHNKGVTIIDIFRPGRFDFRTISMERVYEY